ncbi:MAG TPA: extracellular solute-binding protein [Candidatus Lumbricidophila sp.]|nr:extracellular solute-binding protein [Candidatus Lumbricidophila sp.]
MKRSRLISVAALALGSALALSACSTTAAGGDKTEAAGAKLSFMVFETPALTAKFWDDTIKSAAEKVGGVEVQKVLSTGDRTAYAKQLLASNQLPDLLASINTGQLADLLVPYDEAWLKENFLIPDATAVDGKVYLPPVNSQAIPFVFYNKALFAKAGITAPPKNWAEFMDAVAKLKAAGITPIELAGKEAAWAASYPLVGTITADIIGKDPKWVQKLKKGEAKLTDANVKAALQKNVDLVKAGAYDPQALSVDFATANTNFVTTQKSAMYPMGTWMTGAGYIPADVADQFGVFPWPTDDGSVVVPITVGGTTSVNAKSANVDKAVAFAKQWSTDPKTQGVLVETDGAFPMLKNVKFSEYNAKVSPLFTAAFELATSDKVTRVNAFGQVVNDDALPGGVGDALGAVAQGMFAGADIDAFAKQLDDAWQKGMKG